MPNRKTTTKGGVRGFARRAYLASLGAVSLTREAAAQTFRKWVERGEQVDPQVRQRLGRLTRTSTKARNRIAHRISTTVRGWKGRLPVATRAEIETLSKRIDQLARKLQKGGATTAATV